MSESGVQAPLRVFFRGEAHVAVLEEQVRLATYLQHPGILRVLGMHKAEGTWYLITEHPEANPLTDLFDSRPHPNGPERLFVRRG